MAEEIDLATLNFNTDKLVKNLLDVRLRIDETRNALKESRKEMRESQKAIDLLEQSQKKLADSGNETSDAYKSNEQELKKLRDSQVKTTQAIIEQESAIRNLSKEQRTMNTILDGQNKSQIRNAAAMEKANTVLKLNWESQEEAAQVGRSLINLRKQLNPAIEEEAKMMEKLTARINEANEFGKEYRSENEKRISGIGKYQEAIEAALKSSGLWGKSMSSVTSIMKTFSSSTSSTVTSISNIAPAAGQATSGINTMSVAARALTAIPLVALITAIVAGLMYLFKQFKSTQKGADMLRKALAPISAIISTINSLVGDLAVSIVEAFTSPKKAIKDLAEGVLQNFINRVKAVLVIFEGIKNFDMKQITNGFLQATTGVENMTDKLAEFGDKMSEAVERGNKLFELTKQIEEAESNIAIIRANTNVAIDRLTERLRDTTLTYKERAELAKERARFEEQAVEQEAKIIDMKIEELRIQQQINGVTRENQKEINDMIAQRIELQRSVQSIRIRNQRYISQAAKEEKQQNEEIHKERLAQILEQQKLSLQRFELENKGRQDGLQEELQYAQAASQGRMKILNEEFKQGKKSKEAYELEKLLIEREAQKAEAEVVLFYAQQRLNNEIKQLEEFRSERKRITDESMLEEVEAINAVQELQRENLERQLEAGLISRREYNAKLVEFENDKNQQIKELNDAWDEQAKEDRKLARMLENEDILMGLQGRLGLEREMQIQAYEDEMLELEQRREDGLISEENYLTALENLNKKHTKALVDIDAARFQNKMSLASNAMDNLAKIAGEETEMGKFFASTQATIDTYASAVAAYRALAGINPILAGIASAAAIAQGLQTVAKIQGVGIDFYTGGYTGDGGVFEKRGNVHAGEVVFSQADVQKLGGAAAVESMRPTSDLYNQMPVGGLQQEKNDYTIMASMVAEAVERGSRAGTSSGVIEAEDNRIVKERSRF